jgi:hypothetical protein
MPSTLVPRLDRVLYRAALALHPPEFRGDYGGEMWLDFEAARADACASGLASPLWRWRLRMALDVVRTLGVQWARTGLPLIGLVSVCLPLAIAAGLANVAARARFADAPAPDDPELIGILALTVTSLLVIATTIALTVWAAHPRRPRRKRR